jgi:hypothetical protein
MPARRRCRQEGEQRARRLASLRPLEHGRRIGQHDLDLFWNDAGIGEAPAAPGEDFGRGTEADRARSRVLDEMAVEQRRGLEAL